MLMILLLIDLFRRHSKISPVYQPDCDPAAGAGRRFGCELSRRGAIHFFGEIRNDHVTLAHIGENCAPVDIDVLACVLHQSQAPQAVELERHDLARGSHVFRKV